MKSIKDIITSIKDKKRHIYFLEEMQAADYRLVRSCLNAGIMLGIKQSVLPKIVDDYFSSWLYGQRKSIEQIPVYLSRSIPCLVCSQQIPKQSDVSLLTVDLHLFLQCLPLFNNEQLSIIYSLLDDDRHVYQNAIRQQYEDYKWILIQNLNRKFAEQYYLV
jgi:hypothetical protein